MTGGSMTKAELVEEVSRVSDLTKKHSEVIVDTVFRSIIEALHRGEKIELRGFGSFRLRKREPRKGRNPKTGDKVDVPPKKVPYFKPGKELKELINREATAPPTDGAPERRHGGLARGAPVVPVEARLRDGRGQGRRGLHLLRGRRRRRFSRRSARRRPRAGRVRHPQSLPLQQRTPDGRTVPPRGDAGRHHRRGARRADGPRAARRDGARPRRTGRRASTSASTSAGPPAPGSPSTCTCTSCRGGAATRTS